MKRCQRKIVRKKFRIWIAKNHKQSKEVISFNFNFLLLDENICFPYLQIFRICDM